MPAMIRFAILSRRAVWRFAPAYRSGRDISNLPRNDRGWLILQADIRSHRRTYAFINVFCLPFGLQLQLLNVRKRIHSNRAAIGVIRDGGPPSRKERFLVEATYTKGTLSGDTPKPVNLPIWEFFTDRPNRLARPVIDGEIRLDCVRNDEFLLKRGFASPP